MGLAMSIHRICRDSIAAHGGGSLDWVRVAVGELSAVEPQLLEFAWQAVTGRELIGAGVGEYAITMHPSTSYEDFVEGLRYD